MQRIPVLLDTDPGNDIDDALAIAYLLAQPRCELVGITTVSGDVQQRAAIAEVLCSAADRNEVPIVCGKSLSIVGQPSQPGCKHYGAIAHLPHYTERIEDQAISFIRGAVDARPGEIVLLSIGPLTNIASLFEADPWLPSKLRGFYSMAGAFWGFGNKEWNCICDGEAARRVVNAPRKSQAWFGLDVTTKCQMGRDDFRKRLSTPVVEIVGMMAETWFEETDRITFHDPLAAACLFEPDICQYQQGRVGMDSEGTSTFAAGDGPDVVADRVDSNRFFEHFFDITSKQQIV